MAKIKLKKLPTQLAGKKSDQNTVPSLSKKQDFNKDIQYTGQRL